MLPKLHLSPLLFAAACHLAFAGQSIRLQPAQIKALGIETAPASVPESGGGQLTSTALILVLIKTALPWANIFFRRMPVTQAGRL